MMLASILQNGRKKDKYTSGDRLAQIFKNTEKVNLSQSMSKSQLVASHRAEDRRVTNQKENNINTVNSRLQIKPKPTVPSTNLFANRANFLGNYYSMLQDIGQLPKRPLAKQNCEPAQSTPKARKNPEPDQSEPTMNNDQRKNAYFFRILLKKNKLRGEFNMNIHNSIFTFKQFMKACQLTQPKPIDLKITPETENRKTIVFDMDETLIHTNETMTPNFEIKVPFRSIQGRVGYGFVEVRPHCKEMLKRLNQHFDLIIFTASTQAYADPIIDHIDPERVIKHRLYRQSCSFVKNQIFVKDLRIFGRKLSNIVLVDNAPYSYLMQLENAIPIIPYYRGKDDDELLSLEQYLMKLKDVEDVRTINRDYFKLHEYIKYDSYERLVGKLYAEWK